MAWTVDDEVSLVRWCLPWLQQQQLLLLLLLLLLADLRAVVSTE